MKHLITVAFLVAAIALAMAGSATGFALFIVAGLFFESVFWYRIFRKRKARSAHL